jgi:hypothetical protein
VSGTTLLSGGSDNSQITSSLPTPTTATSSGTFNPAKPHAWITCRPRASLQAITPTGFGNDRSQGASASTWTSPYISCARGSDACPFAFHSGPSSRGSIERSRRNSANASPRCRENINPG